MQPATLTANPALQCKRFTYDELFFNAPDGQGYLQKLRRLIAELPSGAYVAGGFMRGCVAEDIDVSDIDIFFRDDAAYRATLKALENPANSFLSSYRWDTDQMRRDAHEKNTGVFQLHPVRDESCACTLKAHHPRMHIVRLFWYDGPAAVVSGFDFTCVGIVAEGQSQIITAGPTSLQDAKDYKLNIQNSQRSVRRMLDRIIDYMQKGYRLTPEALNILRNRIGDISNQFANDPDPMFDHYPPAQIGIIPISIPLTGASHAN